MKPRGRPRLAAEEPSVNVHFRLTTKQYDETQKQAAQARLSLPEWFRRIVGTAIQKRGQ
jgi:hypothetical protein